METHRIDPRERWRSTCWAALYVAPTISNRIGNVRMRKGREGSSFNILSDKNQRIEPNIWEQARARNLVHIEVTKNMNCCAATKAQRDHARPMRKTQSSQGQTTELDKSLRVQIGDMKELRRRPATSTEENRAHPVVFGGKAGPN